MTRMGAGLLAPRRQCAIRDALNPSGRSRRHFTRDYDSSGHGGTGDQDMCRSEGYSVPPWRERKRERVAHRARVRETIYMQLLHEETPKVRHPSS